MSSAAPQWVLDALPDPLREHVCLWSGPRRAGELSLTFKIPGQQPRTLDLYLMTPETRALATFGPIGCGYRSVEWPVDHGSEAQFCETVAKALHANAGDALLAYLREPLAQPSAPHSEPDPGVSLTLTEYELSLAKLNSISGPVSEVEVFLSSACVQACSFCAFPHVRGTAAEHPPSTDATAWLQAILADLRARPGPSQIVLSGPDCLRHPQLDAMLELLAHEDQTTVQLLGPLTRLSEPELLARVAKLPTLRGVTTSLFGARPQTHDRITGTPGAHAQILAAIDGCLALGIPVGVSTVITPENVAELPELLRLLQRKPGLSSQLNLYHPESWAGTTVTWRSVSLARVVVGPEQLLASLEQCTNSEARITRVRHIPHCWIPARLRPIVIEDVDDRQADFAFVSGCEGCSARERCPGVTLPAIEQLGPNCVRKLA